MIATSGDQTLAVAKNATTEETKFEATSTTANLKVYQTDIEIGTLFILPDSELFVTFKLISPLARTDRCTGVAYNWIHARQSHILPARNRFRRYQRLHTSDGDKAQDLAERILHHDRKKDPKCAVSTFRSQCVVHRVYHVITAGMNLHAGFISGQIRLALSLRGPGNFSLFKEVLWEWMLAHHNYRYETVFQGPGPSADTHRERIWGIYFPCVRGKHQRKNRLKYWILKKLPNGDIRNHNVFEHICTGDCCENVKDFLRKLK